MRKEIRIGTRASALALWQAEWVKSELEKKYPGMTVTLTKIKTTGDKILDVPLARSAARDCSSRRSRRPCWPTRSTSPCTA